MTISIKTIGKNKHSNTYQLTSLTGERKTVQALGNAMRKRWVFSPVLKPSREGEFLSLEGRLFHISGAWALKALEPYVLVLGAGGGMSFFPKLDRVRMLTPSFVLISKREARYGGRDLSNLRKAKVASLYWIRYFTGSQ